MSRSEQKAAIRFALAALPLIVLLALLTGLRFCEQPGSETIRTGLADEAGAAERNPGTAFAPRALPESSAASSDAAIERLDAPATHWDPVLVKGVLRGGETLPPPSWNLAAIDEEGHVRPVTVEAGGRFAVRLRPGNWRLELRSERAPACHARIEIDGRREIVEQDLEVAPWPLLLVRLLARGGESFDTALPAWIRSQGGSLTWNRIGLFLSASGAPCRFEGRPVLLAESGAFGGCLVQGELPQTIELRFRDRVLASLEALAPDQHLEFEIDFAALGLHAPAGLRLRGVDAASGAELVGARVRIEHAFGVLYRDLVGELSLDDLPPGPAELALMHPEHLTVHRSLELLGGQTTELGAIGMEPGRELLVRVRGPAGEVRAFDAAFLDLAELALPTRLQWTRGNAEGQALLAGLPSQEGVLWVRSPGFAPSHRLVDLGPTGPREVDVRLEAAALLDLHVPEGAAGEVWVDSGALGAAIVRRECHPPAILRLALPAGSYTVRFEEAGGNLRSQSLELVADGTPQVYVLR